MTTQKKKVTVTFTAIETDWLLNKLQRIVTETQHKDTPSLLIEKFKAESLIDRIRSEQ